MPGKPPTPQGISVLLRKAGFTRSEVRSQKGLHRRGTARTEGYRVRAALHGRVDVEHCTGFARGPAAQARRDDFLGAYAEALRKAGYDAEITELWPQVIVTAKED